MRSSEIFGVRVMASKRIGAGQAKSSMTMASFAGWTAVFALYPHRAIRINLLISLATLSAV